MQRESNKRKVNIEVSGYLPKKPVDMAVVLTLILFTFYYIWRVAYITPWYDELYTYYYFISRGPLYAAIHWPLPNNHVGYSVLSAILDMFSNPYIGLRGVSFICAIANNFLIFRIGRRFMNEWMAYIAMLLYFCCWQVNELAVQGRGYTLATTCFLVTVRQLVIICRNENNRPVDHGLFAGAMVLGLYTIPSSIYWVIPTCVSAGIFLLVNGMRSFDRNEPLWYNRYFRKLRKLVITGLIAAGITFFLYLIIWLAIGSNLLVKDTSSTLYGMSHVSVILRHPLKTVVRGISYMLSQPYIQSVSRHGFVLNYFAWLKDLTDRMYPISPLVTIIVVLMGLVIFIWEFVLEFKNSRTIFGLILVGNSIGFQIMLFLQAKLPYYRVFSYMGVITAMSIAVFCEYAIINIKMLVDKRIKNVILKNVIPLFPIAFVVALVIFSITNPSYYAQYGDREAECYNALYVADPSEDKKLCVLDCDQQYLLKFGFGIDCDNTDVYDCDYVLVDRNMMKEGYNGYDFWKFYQTYETLPWDYINTEMHIFYENEYFVLYKN